MQLIGLAGAPGSGKDTVADYLVEQYGFVKFSFSDALYEEVAAGFDVLKITLHDRALKDQPHPDLCACRCNDRAFFELMVSAAADLGAEYPAEYAFSPRWVLQHWGTEYRRAQDPDYWTKKTALYIQAFLEVMSEDGVDHPGLVNTSVRFPNEQKLIHDLGGSVWHVHRWADKDEAAASGFASGLNHVAEAGLPLLDGDRELFNTGTVEQLGTAVSLLLQAPDKPADVEQLLIEPIGGPIVVCKHCGKLHYGLTEAGVREQIATLDQTTWAGKEPEIGDWVGCTGCGGTEFARLVELDNSRSLDDVLVLPVLIEEKDNA